MKNFFTLLTLGGCGCFIGIFVVMVIMFTHEQHLWPNYFPYMVGLGIGSFAGLFGGIFGRVASGMLQSARIQRNGNATMGTLISTRNTGLQVNNQPQLAFKIEITLPNGEKSIGEARKVVSVIDMASFLPGMQLPVRYIPEHPEQLALDLHADRQLMQQSYNQILIQQGILTEESINIIRHGIKTRGVIASAEPTGKIIGNNPELALEVKVSKADGENYSVNTNKLVPQAALPKLQPGSVVSVAYLPDDQQKIALVIPSAGGFTQDIL